MTAFARNDWIQFIDEVYTSVLGDSLASYSGALHDKSGLRESKRSLGAEKKYILRQGPLPSSGAPRVFWFL